MTAIQKTLQTAADYLAAADPVLAEVIATAPPCDIRKHTNYYQELVEDIIGQQLSVKAGRAIRTRFVGLFGGQFPLPEAILAKTEAQLRSAGLSRAKAAYIRDLAQHVIDGRVRFGHLDKLSNQQVIAELTDVKGIGEWTAHMFLMFCMGRLDVLAHGDLGIRTGIYKLYKLKTLPTPDEVKELARRKKWHPYETVACWYIWHSLDNAPKT